MYCKDCKFYKYDRTDEIWDEDSYQVKMTIKRGKCLNENLRYGWQLENESQLIYQDSEDWSANLYVGEMFGCVHFKRKEGIQKLLKDIEEDFKALYSVLNTWKEISEIKWKKKKGLNINQTMFMRRECDQLVYDCKKLLEEIEIHESKRVD